MSTNNYTNNLLTDMLSVYKQERANDKDHNTELEIRFKDISREAFEDVYKHLTSDDFKMEFSDPVLECSMNVISENVYERKSGSKIDDTQYIRKIIFDKGTPLTNTYVQKTRIAKSILMFDYIKYSVGLSKEVESKKFSTNSNALVRFKTRVSFDYIGRPPLPSKWRFDLTAVKHGILNEMGKSLKIIKNDLFTPSLSANNFINELNYSLIDAYEIEIEHIGANTLLTLEDINIAKKVFAMINPQYLTEIAYQEEIYQVAEKVLLNQNILPSFKQPTHRLKQLSNQVIALTKNTYYSDVYPAHGFYLTDKADGQRALISINGNTCRILLSDRMHEFKREAMPPNNEITICDSELIWNSQMKNADQDNKNDYFTLYIFDVMVCNGKNVSREGFSTRCGLLEEAANIVSQYIIQSNHKSIGKKYIRMDESNLESGFREIWETDFPYTVDGLILTEPSEPYSTTKNYKWKPFDRNTIDFLAVKCPQKLLGIKPYVKMSDKDLYLLFVGINSQMREKLGLGLIPHYRSIFPDNSGSYYPVQFSPSADPNAYLYYHDTKKLGEIDRNIIELYKDSEGQWVFHQIRQDRKLEKNYFGNDFRVAELTFLNYIDPFNFEELWKSSNSYFTKQANNIYTASNKFKRFVISLLLKNNLSNAKWVIDLASGRGGDLHRYQEIGVENALFIDVDPTAIAELVRRKFAFFAVKKLHVRNWFENKKNRKGGNDVFAVTHYDKIHDSEFNKLIIKDVKSLTVHTMVADLKQPYADLVANTYQYGLNTNFADGIVCNFALHYMCDTIEHLRNILLFNAKMLKLGGLFIFTVMDGAKVFELLKNYHFGQQWESQENGAPKYAIRKDYRGDKLLPTGQMISVLLPFSDQMYQEPLCNIENIVVEASKLGFEIEMNSGMMTYIDKFSKLDRALYDRLTEDDKTYIGLHSYVSLRLVKNIKKM